MNQSANARAEIDAVIAAGQSGRALSMIKQFWVASPSLPNAPFVVDRLAKVPGAPRSIPCSIRILRSFTVEPLVTMLRATAGCWGVDAKVSLGGFNAYPQELLDPNGLVYTQLSDVVILAVQTRDVAPELWSLAASMDDSALAGAAERVVRDYQTWIETFRSRSASRLIVHLLEKPTFPAAGVYDAQHVAGQCRTIENVNARLVEVCRDVPGVYALDYDGLVARHGRLAWFDASKWHTARLPIAVDCLPHLIDEWMRFILPFCGRQAKCLVCDLDDTLWGGVIGEDGMQGIKLGDDYPGVAYQELQRAMVDLTRRGVLLAVCSKNNEADALEAIDKHPAMALRRDAFAAMRINWQDKVQNLREIAAELNIGVDSLVLIDDNPVEREFVREMLPEVTVIDIDRERPLDHAAALRRCPLFERLELSTEDRNRSQLYVEQKLRGELANSVATVEDYYRSLQMIAQFGLVDAATRPRISQLTLKTNQLNATTRRYGEPEIQRFMDDPRARVYWVRVEDRFGDNGIVGVMIVREQDDAWELDTFLMSCRVIGRTVEQAMLGVLAEHARQEGMKRLVGRFIPTAKNAPAQNLFADHGFQLVDEVEDGHVWEFDLAKAELQPPPWIECRFLEART
jgi:FkbH-like protein